MSEKYRTTCKYLNCVENLLILSLKITACISISPFASLGIKVCAITAEIKKQTSIIKKKKKKHDKIVPLGKDKLNIIEVPISKALINLYISHDEFVSAKKCFKRIP